MPKRDFKVVFCIGLAVGVLAQPAFSNIVENPSTISRLAVFLGFTSLAPLALFIAYLISKKFRSIYQFAQYAAVGSLNAFVDLGVLNFEIYLSGISSGIYYSLFKAISFVVATTNSFFWNKYWTFDSKKSPEAKEALKFYGVALIGWGLNVGVASFIVNGLARPLQISPKLWANIGALAGAAITLVWNYWGYKHLVFQKPKTTAETAA